MRHHSLTLLLASSLGGCIIHDNDCWEDGAPGHGGHEGGSDTASGDTGSAPVEPVFVFTPSEVTAGTSVIVSLEADQLVDYGSILSVEFYGDVTICTRQDRDDEMLLSLVVAADAELGAVDAVLEFNDGTAAWLDDALTVISLEDAEDGTGDEGTGDEGTGDEGTGDEGTGDEGTGTGDDGSSGSEGC